MARKRSRGLGLTAAALALAGQTPAADLADLRRDGSLRVLTAASSVFFRADDAERPGFDAEVLASFGQRHGLTLTAVPADWSALLPSLAARKGDVIAGGFSDTPERRRSAAFTREVFPTRNLVVTRKPHRVVATPEQFREEVFGTIRGTALSEALLAEGVPAAQIRYLRADEVQAATRAGRITAMLIGVEDAIMAQRADPELQIGMFVGPPGSLAYAVRPDDVELLRALDEHIAHLRRTPTWNRLVVKYFGDAALDVLRRVRAQ